MDPVSYLPKMSLFLLIVLLNYVTLTVNMFERKRKKFNR